MILSTWRVNKSKNIGQKIVQNGGWFLFEQLKKQNKLVNYNFWYNISSGNESFVVNTAIGMGVLLNL